MQGSMHVAAGVYQMVRTAAQTSPRAFCGCNVRVFASMLGLLIVHVDVVYACYAQVCLNLLPTAMRLLGRGTINALAGWDACLKLAVLLCCRHW